MSSDQKIQTHEDLSVKKKYRFDPKPRVLKIDFEKSTKLTG